MQDRLGKKVVELTGDVTPDIRAIIDSDVIVTTPEKWDGVSRSWQTRSYVQVRRYMLHFRYNLSRPTIESIN